MLRESSSSKCGFWCQGSLTSMNAHNSFQLCCLGAAGPWLRWGSPCSFQCGSHYQLHTLPNSLLCPGRVCFITAAKLSIFLKDSEGSCVSGRGAVARLSSCYRKGRDARVPGNFFQKPSCHYLISLPSKHNLFHFVS